MSDYQKGYDDGTRHEQSFHGNEVADLQAKVSELEENLKQETHRKEMAVGIAESGERQNKALQEQLAEANEKLRWRKWPDEKPESFPVVIGRSQHHKLYWAEGINGESWRSDGGHVPCDEWLWRYMDAPIPPTNKGADTWECHRCGDKWPHGLLFCPNKHDTASQEDKG